MNSSRLFPCLALFTALWATHAVSAGLVAVSLTPIGSSFTLAATGTVGWSFTANADVTVTDLGYFDHLDNGLAESHTVGLWTSGGTLLGSAIVNPASPLTDHFRWVGAPAINLLAGQSYVIGGTQSGTSDRTLGDTGDTTALSFASQITYKHNLYITGAGLLFPSKTDFSGNSGIFGPNFQFTPTAVPEPGTALLLALAGVTLVRRR